MPKNLILDLIKLSNLYKKFNRSSDIGVCVLCFHRISNELDYSYPSMRLALFEKIIKYLQEHFEIIHIHEKDKSTSKPKLVITFDDGYKDFITNALPVLVKYNIKATMNVVVNSVLTGEPFWTQKLSAAINQLCINHKRLNIKIEGKLFASSVNKRNCEFLTLELFRELVNMLPEKRDEYLQIISSPEDLRYFPPMMDLVDLKTCLNNHILIGSHSMSHSNLKVLDEKQLTHEIVDSKNILEQELGITIDQFAFPNGFSSDPALEVSKNAGYKYLYTTSEEYFLPSPGNDVQLVPRIIIFGNRLADNILRINLFQARLKKLFNL